MSTLVLVRHGQSTWNQENLFTGWYDADLSELGQQEAVNAGTLMKDAGLAPTVLHTSLLVRAIRTAELALDVMDMKWLPVRRTWRLNERHYGALQGLDKAQTAARFGAEQVHVWRRSYDTAPDPVGLDSPHHPRNDPRYAKVAPDALPAAECLKDCLVRVLPWWHDMAVPDLRAGEVVLVAAHGNSLRALIKHLDGISDDAIADLNLPTGQPLVYELDGDLVPVSKRYLDPAAASAGADAVKHQAG